MKIVITDKMDNEQIESRLEQIRELYCPRRKWCQQCMFNINRCPEEAYNE